MGLIPTYMIVVKDDPVSEYYASITIPRWKECGYNVKRFDAITPDTKVSFDLVFGVMKTVRYNMHNITKTFTPTEKAVWYSHVSMWLKARELDTNMMVLEHDCYLAYPDKLTRTSGVDFIAYDKGALGCYVISPELASLLCEYLITDKLEIGSGPLGFIRSVVKLAKHYKKELFTTIFHDDSSYQLACNQLYNPEYKTTITHRKGTEAENITPHFFEYILAETGKTIDITKTIEVRTE